MYSVFYEILELCSHLKRLFHLPLYSVTQSREFKIITHRTINLLNWLKLIVRDKKFCKILAKVSLCDERTIIK